MNKIIRSKVMQLILILSFLIFLYHLINVNSKFSIVIFAGILFLLNFNNENEQEYSIPQIFKVFGIIATFYLGWHELVQIKISQEENTKVSLLNIKMTENKLENETFTAMLKILASHHLEVRVGGIYALENLARTNKDFYWPVLHTLISYIKIYRSTDANYKNISRNENIQTDIQEILNFIAEGQYDIPHNHSDIIDLSHIHLVNVELSGGKLAYVNFEDSILENVNFNGAKLTEANFKNTAFKNTSFANTNLTQANFTNTKFTEVDFLGADLTSSKFGNAIFNDRRKNYIWLFSEAKLANVNFCLGFDTEKSDTIEKCALGLICNDFRLSKLFNTTKLPEELGACNFKIHQDPSDLMFKEAIKSGNLASIPSSIPGRIIYKRAPSSI